jgi:transcriptional regulator with XRE-family HTH domain
MDEIAASLDEIAASLKALRKMRGMTQQQVSEASGLSRTSITNIENGRQSVTPESVKKIARALGYKPRVLFELIKPELA